MPDEKAKQGSGAKTQDKEAGQRSWAYTQDKRVGQESRTREPDKGAGRKSKVTTYNDRQQEGSGACGASQDHLGNSR